VNVGVPGSGAVRGREKKVNGPALVYVLISVVWIALWIKMARDEARTEEEPRGSESFFD
jgi:hypothetical protein